jgi:hypothetical protein
MTEEAAARTIAEIADAALPKPSRFAHSLPTLWEILIGAPCWGLAMALSAWLALWLGENDATFQLKSILALYASGGLLAWPPSLFTARYAAHGRTAETRFAAFLLCLVAGTIGATALLFALDYRIFYAQWHAMAGTRTWFFQLVFTSLGAIYQFLVLGVRLYLPLGIFALVMASLVLARTDARQRR